MSHSRHIIRISLIFILAFFLTTSFAVAQSFEIRNPLGSDFDSIPKFIAGALKVMVMVAMPLITLAFVYSGFLFIKAQGNETELKKAKENFLYVTIGALLIMGAWVIATLIGGTVTQLLQG